MSRFLKLSNRIINTACIKQITFDKALEKYSIQVGSLSVSGQFIMGSGSIQTHDSNIYATKKEHPESYATIEKYYNSVTCVTNDKN